MEAEIGSDGTVRVEGHEVGELQGFRFTPDTKSDGPDAKAVRAAAQKALGGEYDKRAERFANAPNGDLAIGSDALLRWLGAPVASLTAGDDPLKPRVVLLADEQLAGPARDKVAQRAERFVTYQVSTILKPLADLRDAEGVEGAARGIAYRLYESFGLLQRRDIAEEVRGLDQDARAALRRLGVRFGAYHIFVPALVKPAPAALMTLLWSIAHDGRDKPGFGEVTQLLATGRTSVAPDPSFDPVFYALSGYRPLGRRAVRVDILERLADLIRPALAWSPGAAKRPDGAFNGREFIVTPAMMSILGATADDMDEILKGLGYRSHPLPQAEVEAEIKRQDETQAAKIAVEAVPAVEPAAEEPAAEIAPADAAELASEPEAAADAVTEPAAPVEAGEPASEIETPATEPESVPAEAPVDGPAPAAPEAAAEVEPVKMVLLWKPSRGEPRGRPQGRGNNRPQGRGPGARGGEGAANEAGGERGAARPGRGGGRREDGEGGERRFPRRDGGKPGQGQGRRERIGEPSEERREDRGGQGRGGRPPFGKEREGSRLAPGAQRPERANKPIDPDSPFAKLAALKDKLGK